MFKRKDENLKLILKQDKRKISYISERNNIDYRETIIGRDGYINIVDNELIVVCKNEIVLRVPVCDIKAGELMNLSGITFKFNDNSKYRSVTAYYVK